MHVLIFPIFMQKTTLICFLGRLQSEVSCHACQDPSKGDETPAREAPSGDGKCENVKKKHPFFTHRIQIGEI